MVTSGTLAILLNIECLRKICVHKLEQANAFQDKKLGFTHEQKPLYIVKLAILNARLSPAQMQACHQVSLLCRDRLTTIRSPVLICAAERRSPRTSSRLPWIEAAPFLLSLRGIVRQKSRALEVDGSLRNPESHTLENTYCFPELLCELLPYV